MSFLNSKKTIPSHELGKTYLEAVICYLYDNHKSNEKAEKEKVLALATEVYANSLKSGYEVLDAIRESLKGELSIFSNDNILKAYQFANRLTDDCLDTLFDQ